MSSPRRIVPVLLVLLVVAIVGWVREATRSSWELVEVVVANKELNAGLPVTAENVDEFTTTKRLLRSVLPKEFIANKQDLIGKRLTRTIYQDECLRIADVSSKSHVSFEPGKDIYTLPIPWRGDVGVGSRVDILGTVSQGHLRRVFTALSDMHVVAINPAPEAAPRTILVSFPVTEDEAKLLLLARVRGAQLDLLIRNPDSPPRHATPEIREKFRRSTLDMLANLGVNACN